MTDGLYQAKKFLEDAKNILVLTSQNPSIDSFASAVSLSYTLNNKGKIVNLRPKQTPQNYSSLFPQTINSNRFVISIKSKEISELYYEKENQLLKIFLSPKDNKINKNDIIFDDLQEIPETESDLLVTIGIENLEKLGDFYEKNFKLFYQTPILNIDNQESNNRFGNVNLISEDLPITLIFNQIIELLQFPTDQNIRTWILAGIIAFSKDKEKENSQEITNNILDLITSDIRYKELLSLFTKNENPNQIKLLETALKKIEFNREKQLPIICLTKTDFNNSNTDPKDLSFILKELTNNILRLPSLLLLWESKDRQNLIKGVFYSSKPYSSNRILETFKG
ncbi:MAG: hypothetical protein NTY11_01315, partial [Candidatus Parcubacteria bacterium]|nr:hypothetical protein [Candidatus Parcubacteria bacterium]